VSGDEVIALFGIANLLIAGGIGFVWNHRLHRRMKRNKEYEGALRRSFRLQNRGHWFILLGGVLGTAVGWIASVSHLVVGVVLSLPVVWALYRLGHRWLGTV
jgi:hypothetical protein